MINNKKNLDRKKRENITRIKKALGLRSFKQYSSALSDGIFSQKEIMESILDKKDTLAIIPTGGGKSFCYQGPALCLKGITIVITPLVALIKDQVGNFNNMMDEALDDNRIKKRYRAVYPGMNNYSLDELLDELVNPSEPNTEYKLLYVSPERLSNPKFVRLLCKRISKDGKSGLRIDQIVIDEVHCLSQWGFDFRESYLTIINFINILPKRPVISAFTATATPQDIEFISKLLGFDKREKAGRFKKFMCIEKRNNLRLCIENCGNETEDTRFEKLQELLDKHKNVATIIYCSTVKQVENLFERLKEEKVVKETKLRKYHGQMGEYARTKSAGDFNNVNHRNIMVATKAFGMGIDNPNVRLIIHYDIPASLEEYYQEIGRAGRSKYAQNAYCYLLYTYGYNQKAAESGSGSQLFMKGWINNDEGHLNSIERKTLESRLPYNDKLAIIYLSKYRFCAVLDFLKKFKYSSQESIEMQNFIMEYLGRESKYASFSALNYHDMTVDERFMEDLRTKKKSRDYIYDKLIRDLKGIIKDVNVLHINNTMIANILRWSPEEYDLGMRKVIKIEEWKRKKRKRVKAQNGDESDTVLPQDIPYDSAFVRADVQNETDEELLSHINDLWKKRSENILVSYIFVADSESNMIRKVFRYNNGEFCKCNKKEIIDEFVKKDTKINGLFTKDRYPEWRNMTLGDHLMRSDEDIKSLSPFAYVKGKRSRSVDFTICGDEKPSYFDMCVADAVYSIGLTGTKIIFVSKIWKVLTGDAKIKFGTDSVIKEKIENSLDKLMNLKISIHDDHDDIRDIAEDSAFLPLTKRSEGELGYNYDDIPPLYKYAEEINGEIIMVPVAKMDLTPSNFNKYKPKKYWNDKENVEDYVNWRATAENAVLSHYILHRVSINRKTRRGQFCSFDTILSVLGDDLNESSGGSDCLYRKVIGILLYYKRLGHVNFKGYIKYHGHCEYVDIDDVSALLDKKPSGSRSIFFDRDQYCDRKLITFDHRYYTAVDYKYKSPVTIAQLDGIVFLNDDFENDSYDV